MGYVLFLAVKANSAIVGRETYCKRAVSASFKFQLDIWYKCRIRIPPKHGSRVNTLSSSYTLATTAQEEKSKFWSRSTPLVAFLEGATVSIQHKSPRGLIRKV